MPFCCHLIQGSPIGDLAIIYRVAPFCIHRIFLPDFMRDRCKEGFAEFRCSQSTCAESIQLSQCILDYLHGNPKSPGPVPWHLLNMKRLSQLQTRVLQATSDIPYGRTAAYRTIAGVIGHPRAYRFVGTALSRNPFPILIPCHRVIRANGTTGEYGGGGNLKQWLLDMESRRRTCAPEDPPAVD